MLFKRFLNFLLTFVILIASLGLGTTAKAQTKQATAKAIASSSTSETDERLATIEKTLDAKRKEYGIPGISLVIVKDDQIIYLKGLGYKDLEKNIAVTPDTLFAIGSSTKAFTALTVLMSADDGKLSLDDPPRKYLPYFKLYDPTADEKITIRDLLSHSSGLNRTDLAFAIGTLNREEVIRVAGLAHPTAKFREKFQYQNVMFTVAGEIAAQVQKTSWEKLVRNRIFKPLGMKNSDVSVKEMESARDYSYGYTYNTDTKENRRVPMRDIPAASPAGAINSSARDMAQWIRFMLNGGVANGKRIVSEKSFGEFVSKQMKVSGSVNYGLGWFLRDWHGHKVIEHGGNIDGFNAQVAFMPDQKLGFVLLTNISGSPLGGDAMEAIWSKFVPVAVANKPAETTANSAAGDLTDLNVAVGTYKFAEAGINVEVTLVEGKLILTVPGQPKYTLENVGGRRFKLIYPGLEGFYATFRPTNDKATDLEVFLEQPQGNYVLPKLKAGDSAKEAEADANYNGPLKDLIGSYQIENGAAIVELKPQSGKIMLIVPGQQPYTLVEKEKDVYALSPLPDTYKLSIKRDAGGTVKTIVSTQPEGSFTFNHVADYKSAMSIDDLMAKVIEASGGENLRKYKSMVTTFDLDMIHQGVSGTGTSWSKAPNLQASDTSIIALGKKIASIHEYFDGNGGGQDTSFTPSDKYTGKQLANAKINADFLGLYNWKTQFKSAAIKRTAKLGDEDTYVVVMTPAEGTPVTLYVSMKSFLVLRKDTLIPSNDSSGVELPISEDYSDYRAESGVMLPHTTLTHTLQFGDIITKVTAVKFDVDIPDSTFNSRAKN